MDICVPAEQILTSGSVCVQYLGVHFPRESVLAVGSDSFSALLADQGLKLWRQGEEDPAAVAVGYSTRLDYRILLSGVTTREAALQRGVSAEKLCENLLEVTMA